MPLRDSAFVAVLACASCGGLPPVIWSGERLDFAAHDDDAETLCAGTLPFADASAQAIAQLLGRPKDERVTFFWLPEGEVARRCTSGNAGGCGGHGQAYSASAVHDHEVVHAFASQMGSVDPFLAEGLAEYLGGNNARQAAGDPRDFVARGRALHDPFFYGVAGRFVAQVVERSSMDAVLDLYRNSDPDDDAEAFDALLARHTDVSLNDVAESLLNEPPCNSLAYRERSRVCSQPPLPFAASGEPTVIEAPLDCADLDTVGREGSLRWHGTLELTEGRAVSAQLDEGTTALLIPCEPGCASGDSVYVHAAVERPQPLWLAAGRHHVILQRSDAGLARLTLE